MLPIFPEGGLTSSVITTVWVGVFVLTFFNLRFGWVLSGLVVPGYLVPLVIVKPLAAAIITVEAVLTYLIVWLFSEKLAPGRWSGLFGRDRFMGLVLASIAVRLTMDGWLLPLLADWLAAHWDQQFDWQSNLQSFGLIVISLMANQFWKPGLARGLATSLVVIAISALIVRYGLMEFTNFRLSGVSYLYEGIASSILASPKAYIILVVTAFIASRMNLRYGWDFSGILIPALIALQWYQPTKILTSFVEAAVIYFLARAILRLPFMANATIEGARKLLLFFNVSFAYKLVLGHAIAFLALDVPTSDFYGFGYLLATLLAIKAHDKDIFPRLMRSTLEISLVGAVAGNLVGIVLTALVPGSSGSAAPAATDSGQTPVPPERLVMRAAGEAHLQRLGRERAELTDAQARDLRAALELLDAGVAPGLVSQTLAGSSLRLTTHGGGLISLFREQEGAGELVLFNPASQRSLAILAGNPAERPGLAMAALALFRQQEARWLVISPPAPLGRLPGESVAGQLSAAAAPVLLSVGVGPTARLELGGPAPTEVDLRALRQVLADNLETGFARQSGGASGRANLLLDEAALDRLGAMSLAPHEQSLCRLERAPATGAAAAVPGTGLEELAFLRFELAEPAIRSLRGAGEPARHLRAAAALAGYRLVACELAGRAAWHLASQDGTSGEYLFLPDGDPDRIILAPAAPSGRLAPPVLTLLDQARPGLLALAPDPAWLAGPQATPFGAISQSAIRALAAGKGEVALLLPMPADLASTAPSPIMILPDRISQTPGLADRLQLGFSEGGLAATVVKRDAQTAAFQASSTDALRYLSQQRNIRAATVWLAPPPAAGTD